MAMEPRSFLKEGGAGHGEKLMNNFRKEKYKMFYIGINQNLFAMIANSARVIGKYREKFLENYGITTIITEVNKIITLYKS